MELMPHVKALLDDLLSMSKEIVIKRGDIAIANETDERSWYSKYISIVNGTDDIYSYDYLPTEVLNKIYIWSDRIPYSTDYKISYTENEFSQGYNKIIMAEKEPTNVNKDDLWVTNYGISGSSNFLPIYRRSIDTRDIRTNLYNKDKNKLMAKEPDELDDDMLFYNGYKLYVKDTLLNTNSEVVYKVIDSYVSADDVMNVIGGLLQLQGKSPENAEYKLIGKTKNDAIYLYHGGFANRKNVSEIPYEYDSDETGALIEYVYDEDLHIYRVKDSTNNLDKNLNTYYRRFYAELYFVDDKYKHNIYEYFSVNDRPDDYYELVNDGYTYYKISDNSFDTTEGLSESDLEGLELYKKYKNTKPGLVDLNTPILNENGDEIFTYIEKDSSTSDIIYNNENPYRKVDNTLYYIDNGNYVEYTPSVGNNVTTFYKYRQVRYVDLFASSDNGKYTNTECMIRKEVTPNSSIQYSIYLKDELGSYVYNKELGCYIIDYNESLDINKSYDKVILTDPLFYYKADNGNYILETNYNDNKSYYFYYKPDADIRRYVRLFSDADIINIHDGLYKISPDYNDLIIEHMRKYVKNTYAPYKGDSRWLITRYDGELNAYYRELNGLPPIDNMKNQPIISRKDIDPLYTGLENYYVYDLSDDQVRIIEENGILDKLKEQYPAKGYLNYLGKHRIDVLEARAAAPFDIIRLGNYSNEESYKIFNNAYLISRNYILHRHYQPEMFDVNTYYGSYIGMIILVHALCICMAQSGEILTHNKYTDYYTVQFKLESFGFGETFKSIPLIYRKNIAKNIEALIRNKGTDDIYDLIYGLFGIDSVDVFEYYIRKLEGKLSIAQVPIHTENVIQNIINTENKLSYDDITNSDKYWGVYESKESVKESLNKYPFNYMNSKYITVNNKFSLSDLNFISSYLLNYILECIGTDKFEIAIDGFDQKQDIVDLLIMLFAIQSIKFGFAGNIPNDIVSTAAMLKFNVNKEITGKPGDDETVKVLDIIDKYYYKTSSNKVYKGRAKADRLRQMITDTGAIITPNITSTNMILDTVVDAYLQNLNVDIAATAKNENSFFNEVIDYRNSAKTINDYLCFNELLKCIATSDMISDVYKLPIAELELLATAHTNSKNLIINKEWLYYNIDKVWIKRSDNTKPTDSNNSNTFETNDIPSIGKANIYKYAYDTIKDIYYESIDLIPNEGYSFTGVNQTETIDLADGTKLFITNADINNFINEKGSELNINSFVLTYESSDNNIYNVYLYRYIDTALTYSMYLKYHAKDLYEYLSMTDSETKTTYIERLDNMFSIIIASIEASIHNLSLRHRLQLSLNDFANLVKYIKIVIDVFKSYTVDLAAMDVIYRIDDYDNNRVKIIDQYIMHEKTVMTNNINTFSNISFNERMNIGDTAMVKDEIIIKEVNINEQS